MVLYQHWIINKQVLGDDMIRLVYLVAISLIAAVSTMAAEEENWNPQTVCPYTLRGYSDGCSGAIPAVQMLLSLLASYGNNRPPWNVAGVDYGVGIATGMVLTDWQKVNVSGITIDNGHISCNGGTGSLTLNGIDFSLHGGAFFYNPKGGCTSVTITNSKFGCSGSYSNIVDQTGSPYTIKHNTFDSTGCTYGSAGYQNFISTANSLVQYNYFKNGPGEYFNTSAGAVDYRFNLIYQTVILDGVHMNYLQFTGGGSVTSLVVSFNTTYMDICGGAEGFQVYNNSPGSVTNPLVANNTMIAKLPPGGCSRPPMTYMIYGNGAGSAKTTIIGKGTNKQNYFDRSGAYYPYYPGSMNQSEWISSDNIDMNTGRVLSP